MTGRRIGVLALAALGAATVAFVVVPAAASTSNKAGCSRPAITALEASDVSDTSVVLSFSIVSESSGGSYTVDIWSPETTKFDGAFSEPGGTFSHGLGGLISGTHYRGTLSVRNDCGGDSALIDFRTPKAPPPPACAAPPSIDDLQVGSIAEVSAVVTYGARSGDPATVHVLVSPGGADIAGALSPPGGGGQVPLSALTPSTAYTVTLVVRNGCGDASRQTQFTTLRHLDCTGLPAVGDLRVASITEASALVTYNARSDGKATAEVIVEPTGFDVSAAVAAPGGSGRVPLSRLAPATKYTVTLIVRNECGQAFANRTFTSLGRISVVVVGRGRVTSAPAGISCARKCTGRFSPGRTVRLTARPAPGWRFASWRGGCGGSARACTLGAKDRTVTARFSHVPKCRNGRVSTPARPCRR